MCPRDSEITSNIGIINFDNGSTRGIFGYVLV